MVARFRIDAEQIRAMIDDEAEGKDNSHYFLKICSYPNRSETFYDQLWMYLNRPEGTANNGALDAGQMQRDQNRWLYVKEGTQMYFSRDRMTEATACSELERIKGELTAFAERLNIEDNTGGKKKVGSFYVLVYLSRAVKLDVIKIGEDIAIKNLGQIDDDILN
eukprot:TRINITY_DN4115_c0_g1_i1.p1 TRINITY_DN4115_c0_g1~~TRINITY_DN4115_c0_g1_i1.p1  ORF type:complete len:164 (-),score=41.96 TRINITY_DN4115_c0_g1_i1:60-551(-)